jgi:hypothetical protein
LLKVALNSITLNPWLKLMMLCVPCI